MNVAINISRVICIFLGIIHLFGQLFFGIFEVVPTIAGVSGILAGSLSTASRSSATLLLFVAPVGVLAIGTDAYNYYSSDHAPGNYYAWPEAVVFTGVLLLIAFDAMNHLRHKGKHHV